MRRGYLKIAISWEVIVYPYDACKTFQLKYVNGMIQEGDCENWHGHRTWYDKKLKARVLLCCSFFKSTGEGKKHVKK